MPTKSLRQAAGRRAAPAPKPGKSSPKQPKVLSRLEQLGVLSKLEKAGVLSLLESNGITLSFIEQNKLLSKTEATGVIGLLSDRPPVFQPVIVGTSDLQRPRGMFYRTSNKYSQKVRIIPMGTPGNLTTLGIFLLLAAVGTVVIVPDDGAGEVLAQLAAASVLGGGGIAAVLGGSFVGELQK